MKKAGRFNIPAIVIASIVNYVLGFLWYSPFLFGERWASELSIVLPKMPPVGSIFGSLLISFIAMWGIDFALYSLNQKGAASGAKVALFMGNIIIMPNLIGQWLFAGKPVLFIINIAFVMVTYVICGLIIGKMRK